MHDYTIEELYARAAELEDVMIALDTVQAGWVGDREIRAMEDLLLAHDVEPDDWYSNEYLIRQEIIRMEAEGVAA